MRHTLIHNLAILLLATATVGLTLANRRLKIQVKAAPNVKALSDSALMHLCADGLLDLEQRGFRNVQFTPHEYWLLRGEKFEWLPMPECKGCFILSQSNGVPHRWNWWKIQTNGGFGWNTSARHTYK